MSNSGAGELSARTPTAVWLNLHELDAIFAALASAAPQGKRPNRAMSKLLQKIGRARERKRKRAMRARLW